ncbi:diguanylate cyclase [Massilia sp. IC2-477]|uniref:diguanylate cyclase domain-containing protein n=1 Tax=Massilia sp. IC2-477 TaxID=2887198 RepID=UPI001D1139F1|nr:diguanylate cyclase [Massilia sp. IC2-477]MCC2958710.1 diguanylate cyclase [Massilia sp. IC2-477]
MQLIKILPRTLKGRLIATVISLVALACLVTTAIALEIAYQEMQQSTGRQQYALLTSAALHLESELDAKRALLETIAEEISAQQIQDPLSLQKLLSQHPRLATAFLDVIALNGSGQITGDLKETSDVVRSQFTEKNYLEATLQKQRGILSEPIISSLTGRAIVLITHPVRDSKGKIVLVLAGGIDMEDPDFFGHIARLRPNATGYIFALTRKGMILNHPNRQLLARNIGNQYPLDIDRKKHPFYGWEGWTLAEDDTEKSTILTFKQVRGPQWILGSSFPGEEAFAGIEKARRYAWACALAVALLAGLIGWAMMIVLLKPLRTLRRHVIAVERNGADIEVLDISRKDEIGALGRAFHSLSVKRLEAEKKLERISQTDVLTGLGNRRQFTQQVDAIVERAGLCCQGLSVIFLDVDKFKEINDVYGHATGDMVLAEFARRLLSAVRPTDRVYRYAGDEFVIVSEGMSSTERARQFAMRILERIREPFESNQGTLHVTTSIGVAVARFPIPPVDFMMQSADAALYKTKRSGRDACTIELVN